MIYTVEALVQGYGGMNDEPAVISGRQCVNDTNDTLVLQYYVNPI